MMCCFVCSQSITALYHNRFDHCFKYMEHLPWGFFHSFIFWVHAIHGFTGLLAFFFSMFCCHSGCREILIKSLTHWGRVTHICVSKLTIIGSDNGLSPDRRQAIIWTNAGILLIRIVGLQWNLKQNSCIFIKKNAFENVVCEIASILSRSQCVKPLLWGSA